MSSYSRSYKDKVLRTEADIQKEKQVAKVKRWFFCITLLILFVGFIFISRLNSLQIKNITVEGTKSASPEDVRAFIEERLTGHWLYVFPKKSIVLFPDSFIKKELYAHFPKFSYVEVKRSGMSSVKVVIQEYEGVYLWCKDDCSFMTKQGVVFMHAPFFSGSAYVKIFGGEAEGYPFSPLTKQELATTELLLTRLRSIGIEPAEFHFLRGVTNRLEVVFYHNGAKSKLFFDTSLSMEMSLDSLYATIRTDAFSRKYKSGLASLEYVDITLPAKVVYRFY